MERRHCERNPGTPDAEHHGGATVVQLCIWRQLQDDSVETNTRRAITITDGRSPRRRSLAFAATALSIGACCSEAVASCPDELPPLTVCSPVTGEPTPWGPLGPVGLVLVAAVLSSVFRDREEEADVGRRRFNAIAASAALLLAAAPRTPGGALAAALLAVGSFALGSVSAKLEGSGTQLAGVACGWAVLLGGVWWAAGLS